MKVPSRDGYEEFSSYDAFYKDERQVLDKRFGPAGPGQQYHHIVTQGGASEDNIPPEKLQLDDDLADFAALVCGRHPDAKLVLIGFSSGGGYALHVAATPLGKTFARTVLLSPMLGAFAPTYNNEAKYAKPLIPRMIALMLLDRVGVHTFDHLTTLLLAVDPARSDMLVGHYSWLLMRDFATRDYAADVRQAQTPLAVVVGEKDELFYAEKFASTFDTVRPGIPVTIVPTLSRTALTTDPSAVPAILAAVSGAAKQ